MNRRIVAIPGLVALSLMLLVGCAIINPTTGTGNIPTGAATTAAHSPTTSATSASNAAAGAFTSVNDMLTASSDLADLFARPINSSDQPLDLLFGNGLVALVGAQTNNDLSDADGTFGDKGSEHGTYAKQGNKITAATDFTYVKSSMGNKVGDHLVSSGAADLAAGSAWYETSTKRAGAGISKSRYDYQFKNGALTALEQISMDVDATGRDSKTNTVKFIVIDKNAYKFAVGTATTGVAQSPLTFDATKDTAAMKTALQDAGFNMKYFGDVSGGTVNMK